MADTIEGLDGDKFDPVELHIANHVNKARKSIEDRIDFRNKDIGEGVKGQNRRNMDITRT